MKVERWAVYSKDGKESFGVSAHELEVKEWALAHGHVAVLLTGEIPEPKKKVRLAPALLHDSTGYKYSNYLYRTFDEAENMCGQKPNKFICWPAPKCDDEGFIHVEENE